MNSAVAFMFGISVLGVLVWASWHDLKTRTIPKISVALVYLFAIGYLFFADKNWTVASLCFCFTFITFICLWAISRGSFGIGDVLILSALGWMVADLALLKAFLLTLGVLTIPYGLFCYWYYRKEAEFYKKMNHSTQAYLYPYMPIVFFTMLVYILIPSMLISVFPG